MRLCENCSGEHDGSYGSGRFCSKRCASCFSTKNKRLEINEAVRQKAIGRVPLGKYGFADPKNAKHRFVLSSTKAKEINADRRKRLNEQYAIAEFEDLPLSIKRRHVYEEQQGQCLHCNNDMWLGNPIKLELDHVDGDKKNNIRTNLRLLCPNCHSFTPTFRKSGEIKKRVMAALKNNGAVAEPGLLR